MSEQPKKNSKSKQEDLKSQLGPIYRKVGTITFTVGLVSILIGIIIDRANDTTPIFTMAVLIISMPLVLLLNTRMLRHEIEKLQAASKEKPTEA